MTSAGPRSRMVVLMATEHHEPEGGATGTPVSLWTTTDRRPRVGTSGAEKRDETGQTAPRRLERRCPARSAPWVEMIPRRRLRVVTSPGEPMVVTDAGRGDPAPPAARDHLIPR